MTTEQTTTTQPTAPTVNWNNLRCLYAEDIKGAKYKMKIIGIRDTPKGARLFCQSGETEAWDIAFEKKDRNGKTLYIQIPKTNQFGKRTGLLRKYVMATGNEPCEEHIGKEIVLYTVESKKSETGKAIRIADVNE